MRRMASVLFCIPFLTGCAATVSEQEFETRRAAMIKDPAAYRKEVQECIDGAPKTADAKAQVAALTGLPPERAIEGTCDRVHKAVASGRITYAQYKAYLSGTIDPEIIKVMQGR